MCLGDSEWSSGNYVMMVLEIHRCLENSERVLCNFVGAVVVSQASGRVHDALFCASGIFLFLGIWNENEFFFVGCVAVKVISIVNGPWCFDGCRGFGLNFGL